MQSMQSGQTPGDLADHCWLMSIRGSKHLRIAQLPCRCACMQSTADVAQPADMLTYGQQCSSGRTGRSLDHLAM